MPTISMFYGILIRMYMGAKEHNPPHIHVYYGEHNAIFSIVEGNVVDGELPQRQRRLVEAWIEIHRDELLADWQLAMSGDAPYPIDPLK